MSKNTTKTVQALMWVLEV